MTRRTKVDEITIDIGRVFVNDRPLVVAMVPKPKPILGPPRWGFGFVWARFPGRWPGLT
jgi:hypothetical protein